MVGHIYIYITAELQDIFEVEKARREGAGGWHGMAHLLLMQLGGYGER